MNSIALLIDRPADRDAVRDLLPARYDVVTSGNLDESDIVLVDERAFPTYHARLQARVEAEHPLFCPIILIRHPTSAVDVSVHDPDEREPPLVVDDIVEAPVTRERLVRRIESLLARRDQSRELHETVQTLADANRRLARHEAIVQQMDDFALVVDSDWTLAYMNETALSYADTSLGAVEGEPIMDLVSGWVASDEDPTRFEEALETVYEDESSTEYPVTVELELALPVGSITTEYHCSPLENEGQKVVVIGRDITEHKDLEKTLRSFKRAVEHAGHSIVITDVDGTIQYVNPAFEEVTGYTEAEALGKTPRILKSGEHDEAFYEQLWETILDGEVWQAEIVNECKNGEQFIASQTIAPVFNEMGAIELFVAINHDITERKEREQQLEEQRDNLDILNQVLRHDIRNDLQMVTSYAELLSDSVDGEKAEYLDAVRENAAHAVDLTTTAREMAEVMLTTADETQYMRLRRMLKDAVDEIQAGYPDAEITIEPPVPSVKVQATEMLDSVFDNVLKNAIQHNDKDVPEVTVAVTERDQMVLVRIADNGPGVPDNQKEEIFGKGETGLDSSGTGIGLYLVQTLVDMYGGDVWVEDKAAAGDTGSAGPEATETDSNGAVFMIELPKPAEHDQLAQRGR
ncbi:PAS domain S-box protein [Halorientalis brevis]|uniref:histidine kinase n=1 Tax=Halorientalis brevis TaxID=1126241 RepID=A0ABD6CD12_9EURY|nr:PAS domain S-box protein [Halorientalis brevis]